MGRPKNEDNTANEIIEDKVNDNIIESDEEKKEYSIPSINMNDKSKVKSLVYHPISWERLTQNGDEYLKGEAVVYINNAEIETQVQNNNIFFIGKGLGDHAHLYIENSDFREYLGFDNKLEGKKQFILDEEKCKEILGNKTILEFENNLKEYVVTNHEKTKIMNYARKIKLNDYDKIQILSKYCNMEFTTK